MSSKIVTVLLLAGCAATPPAINVTVVHECDRTHPGKAPEKIAVEQLLAQASADRKPEVELASTTAKAPAHAHWEYEGAAGPEHWGHLDPAWKTCSTGTRQSPIDLEELHRQRGLSPIVFAYRPTEAKIVDNGHTVQVNFARGSHIQIDRQRYELVQFHVHSPSEHTVRGEHHAMELHLVHKDAAGKLAVIGVFYDDGPPSPALGYVWEQWPAEKDQEQKIGFFDPTDLLPADRAVTRYDGSLTTPPCSEGVVWNVLRAGRTESTAHLDRLRERYPNNARPVVERSDRGARGERSARNERPRR